MDVLSLGFAVFDQYLRDAFSDFSLLFWGAPFDPGNLYVWQECLLWRDLETVSRILAIPMAEEKRRARVC